MVSVLDKLQHLCDEIKKDGVGIIHCSKDWCKWNNVADECCTICPYIDRTCSCITYQPRDEDNRNDLIHPFVKRYPKR